MSRAFQNRVPRRKSLHDLTFSSLCEGSGRRRGEGEREKGGEREEEGLGEKEGAVELS